MRPEGPEQIGFTIEVASEQVRIDRVGLVGLVDRFTIVNQLSGVDQTKNPRLMAISTTASW